MVTQQEMDKMMEDLIKRKPGADKYEVHVTEYGCLVLILCLVVGLVALAYIIV